MTSRFKISPIGRQSIVQTFYAHFPDKYALLDGMIREGFGHTLRERLGSRTDTTPEFLRQLFLAVTDHLSSIETRCRRSFQMFEFARRVADQIPIV